jgi:C-terminal processing protease CtpA/Prc
MLIPCSVSAQKKCPGTLNALVYFDMFIRDLNKHYIDTVNNNLLIQAAIRGVLSQLDPHST